MKRFHALWRETWWLWAAFAVGGIVFSFLSPIFLLIFPISIVTFLRFAYVQYDDDGNFISN